MEEVRNGIDVWHDPREDCWYVGLIRDGVITDSQAFNNPEAALSFASYWSKVIGE